VVVRLACHLIRTRKRERKNNCTIKKQEKESVTEREISVEANNRLDLQERKRRFVGLQNRSKKKKQNLSCTVSGGR
jgi:hypothetical protein